MRTNVLELCRGGEVSGQQRQVIYLLSRLAGEGYTPIVIADNDGSFVRQLKARGIETLILKLYSWRSLPRIFQRYQTASRFLKIAKSYNVQLIHAHDVWRAEYARFISDQLGIPYVVHVRGPLGLRDIRKHRLDRASAIIAIAQRYVDDLLAAGISSDRIVLIDDGVDLELFSPDAIQERENGSAADRNAVVIAFNGLSDAQRPVREFIEVVRHLDKFAKSPFRVKIIGSSNPSYPGELSDLIASLNLTNTIALVDRIPSDRMPAFLAGIDILASLSGGSTMFEAMAMEKAVFSARADGRHSTHTVHDRTAWCVDTIDPLTCARQLAKLIDDTDLRHRLAVAGRQRVISSLDAEQTIQETAKVYGRSRSMTPAVI